MGVREETIHKILESNYVWVPDGNGDHRLTITSGQYKVDTIPLDFVAVEYTWKNMSLWLAALKHAMILLQTGLGAPDGVTVVSPTHWRVFNFWGSV